ncbi:MAG: hypothetical protein U9Q83_06225, partial [Bacteroidota bacterium]|nr:hypothetical protein [Bacteroidota bacterium]
MSKNKSENGLWIQHKVLYNKNMSTQEKFIVAQVIALHENGACFAGNRFFAEMLNVTTNRIS